MAIGPASMFHGALPSDADFYILSFLEEKDLGKAEQVCKDWKVLAGNDRLWRNLFIRLYNEEVPEKKSGKEACLLRRGKAIPEGKLIDTITCFLCRLKWDTKRRLECTFPNEPTYSLVIEQSFGPRRGTPEGFKGPVNETEYYKYMGKLSPGQLAAHTFTSSNEEKVKHLSIHRTMSWTTALDSNGTQILRPESATWYGYFPVEIKGVDVGYGNTLAYYSDINGWKQPFKLTCISGSGAWVGLIPWSKFKFVKIDPTGQVTWEKDIPNAVNRSLKGWRLPVREYFRVYPIQFQD